MKNRAGYERQNLSGDLAYFSFVPAKLPPEPELEVKGELLSSLMEAKAQLAVLNKLSSRIRDDDLFLYMYVRKEALLSSQIEGTQATLEDILAPEYGGAKNADVQDVSNYVAAINYAVKRLDTLPLSNRLLKETHSVLLSSGRGSEKNPGEFRRSQNWIGGAGSSLKNARYIPPSVDDMLEGMSDLEKFIHEDDGMDPLIKAGLIHYQFETIHPFLDGNGRIGRMLITLFLLEKGLISSPIFYISYFLKQNRVEYYDRLSEVRHSGNYEQWLNFFLQAVSACSLSTVSSIELLESLHKKNYEKIASSKSNKNALLLFSYLEKHPIIDISGASSALGLSYNSVSLAVRKLQESGILFQVNGQARNRSFCYQEYLDILKSDI
ncbi:MAG: Fic family protein [Bacillota bacterium]|nr:Fic family protein [Bacillota bacterium]